MAVRIINESNWSQNTVYWRDATQKKLDVIFSNGRWNDFEKEVRSNPITKGLISVYMDCYEYSIPGYGNVKDAQVEEARKELFKIINKFYNEVR